MLCNGSISACGAAGVSSILTFRFEESNKSGFDSLQLERVGVTGASSDATSATFFRFSILDSESPSMLRRFEQERTEIKSEYENSKE